VGYYNDVGGITIGKVWRNLGSLASAASQFGEGTVDRVGAKPAAERNPCPMGSSRLSASRKAGPGVIARARFSKADQFPDLEFLRKMKIAEAGKQL